MCHWSKIGAKSALPSGEAELNRAVKGISEVAGVMNATRELRKRSQHDSHCGYKRMQGMLPRTVVGNVKRLSTTQLCAQGAIQSADVEVHKVRRTGNALDIRAPLVEESQFKQNFRRMEFRTPEECLGCSSSPPVLHKHGIAWEARCGLLGMQAPQVLA